jgi:peptidoglycan-associated lipoprotein
MNKYLLIAVTFFLCISISGCATKTAPQATTALPVAEKSTTVAEETISQPKASTSAVEESAITDPRAKSLAELSIAIEPVYFNYDSFLLSETSRESLVNTSQVFLQNRALKAIVAGHCDDRGSEMYNIALGEKRALSVKNYLATLGVEADRLEVVSYGEEKPAASGFDEESRALNRRVEFM